MESRLSLRALAVLTAFLLLPTGGAVVPARAATFEKCNPAPKQDSSFCVTGVLGLGTVARDPLGLTLTLANGSTSYANDTSKWMASTELSLTPPADGAFSIAGSQSLPHNLIVAGGGTCTSADTSGCAGYGTARVYIAAFSSFQSASVEIDRLTNVNPPPAGLRAQYRASGSMCLDSPAACATIEFPVDVPLGSASGFDVTFQTRYQGTVAGTAYDAAIADLNLSIDGDSNTLWNGSAVEDTADVRVLSLPNRCGDVRASVTTATAEATPRTVTSVTTLPVTGCPTAAFTATPDGFVARFNGGASKAAGDRAVDQWRWAFGDGTTKTTATPTVTHRYSRYGNHTVTLVVVDTHNARSAPLTKTVKGTTTSVSIDKSPERVLVFGAVSPNHAGKSVTLRLQRKRDGLFRTVDTKSEALNDRSRYAKRFDRRAAGSCRVVVTFPGDADHLGSRASKSFTC
jgi:PKD domain